MKELEIDQIELVSGGDVVYPPIIPIPSPYPGPTYPYPSPYPYPFG